METYPAFHAPQVVRGDAQLTLPELGADGSEVVSVPVDDLSYSWDRTTGLNGDKLHLTITLVQRNHQGSSVAALKSRSSDDV